MGEYSFSQQYLNKTYLVDGSFYSPVTMIPTDTGYLFSASPGVTFFLLDSSANLKWKKLYNIGPAYMNNLYKTSNGNYITTSTVQWGGIIENLYLIKLNNLFDTLFTKVYIIDSSSSTSPIFSSCFEDNSGSYIILGHSSKDSLGNASSQNGLFIKTDTPGNIINYKLIGPSNDADWFNTGLQMGNNYYLFGGTYSYASGGIVGMDRMDGWVVKTDLQGNEVASVNYGNPTLSDGQFTNCNLLSNNKIIITSNKAIEKIPDTNAWIRLINKTGLLVFNPDLSISYEKYFKQNELIGDSMFCISITNLLIDSDSSYFCYGTTGPVNVYTQIGNKRGLSVKINKNFQINYFRKYAYKEGTVNSLGVNFYCGSNTEDKGYILGGEVQDLTMSPIQQSWLVKTDSLGCDGFHSCDDTTLVCEILQSPDTACNNDTAWLQVRFKGRSAPYFVYANTALALDSVYYPYTLPLWIDTLVLYVPHDTDLQQVIVKVKDPWGWYNTDTVQIFVKNCNVGNIEEAWYPKKVEIYPNPATSELHVKFRTPLTEPATITINDMQGKAVKQITTKQNENVIDISGLVQGVYGIKVVGNNMNASERFVKM